MRAHLLGQRRTFLGQLLLELRVATRQRVQLDEVAGAPLQAVPRRDHLAVL